jgi:O-methyltransferase
MAGILTRALGAVLERRGYELSRRVDEQALARTHPDLDPAFFELYPRVASYSMTSPERLYALYQALLYVHAARIAGDVVECGVWRGGSSMLAALALSRLRDTERNLWLYDTFEGMSEPGDEDVDVAGERMTEVWDRHRHDLESPLLAYSSIATVRANLARTGFPEARTRFVRGKVEETIPDSVPDRIAVLRLDTDWYESTRHELIHLYPRLEPGGVLIIDDYGHWQGARQAVDSYFDEQDIPILLNRIDYTGRIAVKPVPRSPR